MADRSKSIKSKIVPGKDLGNPKAVTLLPEGQNSLHMGTVIGRCNKVIQRTMPNGDIYEGFSGFFEAVPSNPQLPVVQSGVCYFPTGFHELVAEPLKQAQKDDPNAYLDFMFEIEAVKDGNPQGYSWRYTPKLATTSADPLAHLRTAQLAAPTPEPVKPEAPQAEKQTAKRK